MVRRGLYLVFEFILALAKLPALTYPVEHAAQILLAVLLGEAALAHFLGLVQQCFIIKAPRNWSRSGISPSAWRR